MTDQVRDRIIIDGSSHRMMSCPLDKYREECRPDMVFFQASPDTSCWRGYVAEWEIDDGKLFLLHVDGYVAFKGRNPGIEVKDDPRWGELHPELFQDKMPATLSELFGSEEERIFATWYSDELRVSSLWTGQDGDFIIPVVDGNCGERKHVRREPGEEDGDLLSSVLPF
jgi:hypothetical protein